MITSVNDTNVWVSGINWYWLLLTGSTLVEPEFMPNVVQDDPDDDKFFACALASSAEYIVSEDKDLIRVGQYKTVRVISKQAFIQLIENEAR